LISALSSLLFAAAAWAAVAVPPLESRVTDLTGTLTGQQRSALEQTLAEFEARKGPQIAVLLVPTTQPETIEQYAVRVEETWKLGRKGVDDAVLFVIAKQDRKIRIEVGYGLEGALPDAAAKRIIEDDITPRFRDGDFYGGIRAGADRVMRTIEGEPLPAPRPRAPFEIREGWFVPALIAVLVARSVLNLLFGRFAGSSLTGGLAGFLAWLIVGSMIAAVFVGFAAFLFGLTGGLRPGIGYGGRGGGWGGGFGGGSFGGGGFGGGGGFSGGGGSSGGGGASGSW
jgi:uncharacterized protein